jgi:hypothetical protein
MKRYVLVELDAADWGVVDAASYVVSRDMRGFMGTVRAIQMPTEAVMALAAVGGADLEWRG